MSKLLKDDCDKFIDNSISITLRIVCIVVALCFVVYACDASVQKFSHIDITNYPESIDYGLLSAKQIETFDSILDAVKNEKSIISRPAHSNKEWYEILTQLGLYFGTIERIEYLISWNKDSVNLNLSLFKELADNKIIIDARIDEAVSTLREGSDWYKLWQISNYISAKITYDLEYRETIDALNGKGVCSSYTMLFYKMATRLGIKAYTCYGYTPKGYHTWNMVEIDGKYVYYDITFYDSDVHRVEYIYSESSWIEKFQINNRWCADLEGE